MKGMHSRKLEDWHKEKARNSACHERNRAVFGERIV